MLDGQIVFGCARLKGGAYARSSARLIEYCLRVGIRHFDTAPSYGMGTAEAVVGDVVSGVSDVFISAKVGSVRPIHAILRTYASALKSFMPARLKLPGPAAAPLPTRVFAHQHRFDFSPAAMKESLDQTRGRLRRDRLDYLFLHEAPALELIRPAIEVLEQEKGRGAATEIGYASGQYFDRGFDAFLPSGFVPQFAARPSDLQLDATGLSKTHFLHTIASAGFALQKSDAAFGAKLSRIAAPLARSARLDLTALEIAIFFIVLHATFPSAKLIFASTSHERVRGFVEAMCLLENSIGVAAVLRTLSLSKEDAGES
ncbi:aldo/keto reductase [Bradyrhizobium sp. 197]|uniref:aldo/keto reductase n=1 Tax=Bradyrhizobium sp. 197 TaxID=2782663 RepID=UPI001FFA0DD4|nr:aldo/keto reductase [Bradyrhizobium sp. 197]MCK1473611.1 aldo/keto reductase [Bradyrhizobium sp. 197]